MRKAAWILAIVVVLVTGVVGLMNAPSEFREGRTALQRTVSVAVLLYGVLGAVGAVGLAMRRRWSVGVCAVWAFAVVYAATIASFAFGDPKFTHSDTIVGTAMAAISTALVGVFVVWAARDATRAKLPSAVKSDHIPSP